MPIDASIPLQMQQFNPMSSLTGTLQTANALTNLQTNRATQQAQIDNANAIAQTNQANANVAQQTQDAKITQSNQIAQQSQIETHKQQYMFDSGQTQDAYRIAGATLGDPRINTLTQFNPNDPTAPQQSNNAMQALSEAEDRMIQSGIPAVKAKAAMAPLYLAATHNPSAVPVMLSNIVKSGMNPQGQAQQSLVTAGGQQQMGTDLNGNLDVNRRDQFGNVQAPTALPGNNAPVTNLAPGQKDMQPQLSQETLAAKNAAMQAPILHQQNQGILQEIDKAGPMGQGGSLWQGLLSKLGYAGDPESATAYNMVGKYLERNALTAAQSMGPQTNAGLSAQVAANGSTGYDKESIKRIARLNDAIVSGSEAYNSGLQKAVSNPNGNGVLNKTQFDSQWANAFDVNSMKLYNAKKAGDTAEVNRILTQDIGVSPGNLSNPQNDPAYQAMIHKAQLMQMLTKQGSF